MGAIIVNGPIGASMDGRLIETKTIVDGDTALTFSGIRGSAVYGYMFRYSVKAKTGGIELSVRPNGITTNQITTNFSGWGTTTSGFGTLTTLSLGQAYEANKVLTGATFLQTKCNGSGLRGLIGQSACTHSTATLISFESNGAWLEDTTEVTSFTVVVNNNALAAGKIAIYEVY